MKFALQMRQAAYMNSFLQRLISDITVRLQVTFEACQKVKRILASPAGLVLIQNLPDMSDCSDETMPPLTEKSILKEADLVSMWEYMLSPRYANKRLSLYSFLNDYLRKGWLSNIVGFKVLNYIDKAMITPFAFDTSAWIDRETTYVVRKHDVNKLRHNNADFNALMNSGKYIYADGHVVRNDPRFVKWQYDRLVLTDEAARRVDKCCLRFVRQYIQRNPGQYILGCMFSDPHYVEVSLRYLEQIMEEKNMDDIDARMEYEETFPRTFIKAFDKIMEFNGETRETVAARLHISTDKLAGILNDHFM